MEREKRYFWRKEVDEERIDPSSADQTEDILCNGNKIEDFYYNDSRVKNAYKTYYDEFWDVVESWKIQDYKTDGMFEGKRTWIRSRRCQEEK